MHEPHAVCPLAEVCKRFASWHVQQKIRTCCCSDLCIQSQWPGRIAFGQSMARRVPNSLVQWAHLNPRSCEAFLTGRLSWPVGRIKQGTSLQGPGLFLGQLAASRMMQGRTLQQKIKNKRETKSLLCHAHRQSCIRYRVVLESWQM